MKATMESAEVGRMSTPRQIQSNDLDKFSFCKIIGVVEYREYEVDEVSLLIIIIISCLDLLFCWTMCFQIRLLYPFEAPQPRLTHHHQEATQNKIRLFLIHMLD